jgi:hypothetical protein
MNIIIDQLVELAQLVESEDPIDWGMLQVDELESYRLITLSVVEQFGIPITDREMLLMLSLIKLTVENFTLNLKLLGDPR